MDTYKVVIQLPHTAIEAEGLCARDKNRVGDSEEAVRGQYKMEREILSSINAELVDIPPGNSEELVRASRDADAILLSWGVFVGADIISELDKCLILALGSVGTDMVDVDAATAAGIVVTNAPDVFVEETADHVFMLLLAAARRLPEIDQLVRQGDWGKGRPILSSLPRMWGQTLGIIGFGNIGTAVARRAQAFGLHIIAYDPYVSELKMTSEHVEPVSMKDLLERSDFVSIHSPLNAETNKMIGETEFMTMKNSAILVNCSRGEVINEGALIRALQQGDIAGAGLDVLEQEPPEETNPLLSMSNVILTPHAASATARMRPAGRRKAAREVVLALQGKWPTSPVNPSVLARTKLERWQPISMNRGPNR